MKELDEFKKQVTIENYRSFHLRNKIAPELLNNDEFQIYTIKNLQNNNFKFKEVRSANGLKSFKKEMAAYVQEQLEIVKQDKLRKSQEFKDIVKQRKVDRKIQNLLENPVMKKTPRYIKIKDRVAVAPIESENVDNDAGDEPGYDDEGFIDAIE